VDEGFYDFHDVAQAIAELDLVISCDTAVANLAGAMGKETWVLVPYSADWRWMATGESTLWYPSVKVYRQGEDRTWGPVIEKVKQDLLERLK
jgi:ADP-heptose:LPS heptosyltransferase